MAQKRLKRKNFQSHYFSFTCSAKKKEREKEQEMRDAEKKKSANNSEDFFIRSMIASPYSNNINFHFTSESYQRREQFSIFHSWLFYGRFLIDRRENEKKSLKGFKYEIFLILVGTQKRHLLAEIFKQRK